MEIVHCSFCKHGNPADAKFCNACGSSLTLQLCQACGAIDNISATVCYKCGQPFAPGVDSPTQGDDEAQCPTPPAQAGQAPRTRPGPWKLLALLAVVAAATLVIYPRVAGDEAPLSAPPLPADLADAPTPDSPAPDSPPAVAADAAAAPETSAPAHSSAAEHEEEVEAPSSTDTTAEAAADEPPTTTQPTQAQSADVPDTATPQATPAGCSPAIDALGLCPQGFR